MNFLKMSAIALLLGVGFCARAADTVALANPVILNLGGDSVAAPVAVLQEELSMRNVKTTLAAGLNFTEVDGVIALALKDDKAPDGIEAPSLEVEHPEAYRILVGGIIENKPCVWIIANTPRGLLYGVGDLLRKVKIVEGALSFNKDADITTHPAYPIRGHQIGFRNRANSWDAWTVAEMDQYIRELTFFGANSIENIPFQDETTSPLMVVPRREMNKAMSEICHKYGIDYWVWTPADFDLKDAALRAAALEKHRELYADCPELTGVFFPGGDPGDNSPELVLPFLEDVGEILLAAHPKARVWLSMQGFNPKDVETSIDYFDKEDPAWFGGFVGGPSSPPIPGLRKRIPERFKFRDYPDITHNKLSQYPVPWWDQALALTLGREAINPRPVQYAYMHNWFAPFSDGFISYSDGVHDDVNKAIWSALSWNPDQDPRDILIEYANVFFDSAHAGETADAILALEKNWRGALKDNGTVEGTLLQWEKLDAALPQLRGNWRWQMCLVRAAYDAYVRRRLINETEIENKVNGILSEAEEMGADKAMEASLQLLQTPDTFGESPQLRGRIIALCEELFQSIKLQTSVEKYHASGAERGAILDFIDIPLNNRWWLEDEFARIQQLPEEGEKVSELLRIAHWENPCEGSFYDDIGNPAQSPRVLRSEEVYTEPGEEAHPEPTLWWWDNGKSRERLSWQCSMGWPQAVVYDGLDDGAAYTVRTTGIGQSTLRIDGKRAKPTLDGKEIGEFKEYPVPKEFLKDRKLTLTWDFPLNEAGLNWRQQSRVSEVWLLKGK